MEIQTTKFSTMILGMFGLILLPLGAIWSVNTLFGLGIEYTFLTWLGAVFIQLYLQIIIRAANFKPKEK
tara:strand:+ start:925 stop:1131 length:207 start_codon:yes stop_codon:yes gene_type:complete